MCGRGSYKRYRSWEGAGQKLNSFWFLAGPCQIPFDQRIGLSGSFPERMSQSSTGRWWQPLAVASVAACGYGAYRVMRTREQELRRCTHDQVGELGNVMEPFAAGLGLHLVEVYWLAKAEVGFVEPTIAEIKVTERRVDRIMRDYEAFEFSAEQRGKYQLRIAMMVVTPSDEEEEALTELRRLGTTRRLHDASKYAAGEGYRKITLADVVFQRATVMGYLTQGAFMPKRK